MIIGIVNMNLIYAKIKQILLVFVIQNLLKLIVSLLLLILVVGFKINVDKYQSLQI